MRKATLAVLAGILLLCGCAGSSSHHNTIQAASPPITVAAPSPTQVLPAPGHPCDPLHYAMQCGLFDQPRPPLSLAQSIPSIPGVDFAWGGPRSCSAMRSLGARFGWSYFSYDPGKNWTRALVNQFHACGIQTAGGWETTAERATAGPIAGASDAMAARGQAAAVGDTQDAIVFAIDCDCPGYQLTGYFSGARGVLGNRVNGYGGYYQLLYLYQRGLVGHLNFQTYAWSRGLWLPVSIAPLEQYLNDNSVDYDRALAANFGQFPAATPPDPIAIMDHTLRHFAHGVTAREYNTAKTWAANHCLNPPLRAVCVSSHAHLLLLAGRLWFVAYHPLEHGQPTWGLYARGTRFKVMWNDLHQRR